jgi:hypothetical protein
MGTYCNDAWMEMGYPVDSPHGSPNGIKFEVADGLSAVELDVILEGALNGLCPLEN